MYNNLVPFQRYCRFLRSWPHPYSTLIFGTNRKRVCNFLLVRHSNIGPILHRFGDIAGFLCFWVTPPLFHPNFRGVPVAPDCPCLGPPPRISLKLFGREIIFELWRVLTYVIRYLNVTDRWTDRQTDNILWHNRPLCNRTVKILIIFTIH